MRNEFDRIVIGGGAAGLFAAGWAAKSGLRVLVLEKRERPARKILVTGKGRCNVTNHCSPQEFIAAVRRNPRFLMSAIYAMTPQDTMACFEELGVALKTERGNRVFPVSDRAMDIADALVRFARQGGVQIKQATVSELIQRDDAVVGVNTEAGEEFFAPLTILATGGKSYPGTGSDGSGYALAAAVGHTIIPPRPSLVPIICENTDKQFTTLMGLSLRNVTLNLIQKKNGKVIYSELGEMLFTHFGISGPLALTASSYMDVPTDYRITIDCKPGLTAEQLDARMLRDFEGSPNRAFGNALEALLPHSLIPVVVAKSGIPAERRVNQLTREERQKLGALIKAFPLTPQALRPIEEAVITAGGVSVKEIDPRTMRSKLVKGLAFAGGTPCAAVSPLEALAKAHEAFPGVVCAVMDARRGQYYNALFQNGERLCSDRAIDTDALLAELGSGPVLVCGDGAALLCERARRENLRLAPESSREQNALSVALCGYRRWSLGYAVTPDALSPVYLRKPQAEREREERMNKGENKE